MQSVSQNTNSEDIKLKYYHKWLSIAKEIVLKNIDKEKFAAFLYGSMVYDPVHAYDMDIGFLGNEKIPYKILGTVREELEESIVPFRFDLVDFKDTDAEFRKFAFQDIVIWNKPDYIELK